MNPASTLIIINQERTYFIDPLRNTYSVPTNSLKPGFSIFGNRRSANLSQALENLPSDKLLALLDDAALHVLIIYDVASPNHALLFLKTLYLSANISVTTQPRSDWAS